MKNLFSVLLLIPIITFCQNNNALTFDGIDDWVDVISFNHSENTDMTIRVNAKGVGSFFSTEVSGYQTYFSYYPEDNDGTENYVVYEFWACLKQDPERVAKIAESFFANLNENTFDILKKNWYSYRTYKSCWSILYQKTW